MSANTNTTAIVDKMKFYWVNATPNRGFYFGWPQEVDNIHSKTLPLMVLNPPEIIVSTKAWSSNTISTNSNWTLISYDILPSRYNITDDLEILEFWDKMEDDVMFWIYNWWYYYENVLGIEFILTAPIQIIRMKEASNDRLLALKVTFGFNFFRLCANTNDFPNID